MSSKLNDTILNLRLMSRQFDRASKKAEKNSKQEKTKIMKAIKDGNAEGARIYAENAIREHNTAQTFMRYSSRMDGVVSRLQMQSGMMAMTQGLAMVSKNLQSAMDSMDMKKIKQVMSQFQAQMDHMDVASEVVMKQMDQTTDDQVAQSDVSQLISQVAAEHQLQLDGDFAQFRPPTALQAAPAQAASAADAPAATAAAPADDIDARLQRLLGGP